MRNSPHNREARLTSVRVGSTASAAARRACPGSNASAQPSAVRDSTLATTSAPTPALIPSRTSNSTGALRANGRITSGSSSSRCRTPPWAPDTAGGSSLVCAASARPNATSCAARRARTAARTAASPAPRSGSLAPGAASLTAESTQASLPECRSSSGCRDVPPTAALSASQRANRTAAWNAAVRGSASASRWVATRVHARSTSARAAPAICGRSGFACSRAAAPARAARSAPASDANRRVSPEGSKSEPSARPAARLAVSSSSARASRASPLARLAGSWSIPAMTAEDSPAHDRSTAEAGVVPPSRGSRRIRASRASCIASGGISFGVRCAACAARSAISLAAPSRASPRRPATSPSGTASRASPARSRCRNGWPAAPARPAAQSRTVPVRASPASARRSATRVTTARSAVQPRTLVASTTGSVRPRCAAATAPRA